MFFIIGVYIEMVPEAGLEPARLVSRGILNPLCLPIPPLGHRVCYLKQVDKTNMERHTRLELVTSTLARSRSTN